MKNLAFIFPGQGSQAVGMGKDLYEKYPEAKEVFDEANEVLGFDLAKLCFEGPAEELNKTENTQPALLATSIAAFRVLAGELPKVSPALLGGHSLGEYTALVAAGVLTLADGLRIVHERGKFMQEAVGEGEGKMAAILSLDRNTVEHICMEASTESEKVVAANINSPLQIVISGAAAAVDRACEAALEAGARRVIPLPVSVPSHSPLMAEAAEKLRRAFLKLPLGELSCPIVSNVEAELLEDTGRIGDILKAQLTSPVEWMALVLSMKDKGGIEIIIEVGPGKVLTGLTRRIDGQLIPMNFGVPKDLYLIKKFLTKGAASTFKYN